MTVEFILNLLEQENFDYGLVWSEEKLISVFNLNLPDLSGDAKSIINNAKRFELQKTNAYLMINEQLLKQGKCFIQDKENYRVPLISEMNAHITKYYNSSNRKFKRAEKLRKSFSSLFPVEAKEVNDKLNRTVSMRSSQSKQYVPMTSV